MSHVINRLVSSQVYQSESVGTLLIAPRGRDDALGSKPSAERLVFTPTEGLE